MHYRDSDFLAYGDESGTANLRSEDPKHPVFALVFCLFQVSDYVDEVVPRIQRLKIKHFGHDQVVLHSADLRKEKSRKAPFSLLSLDERAALEDEVDDTFSRLPMRVVGVVIDKPAAVRAAANSSFDAYEMAQAWCGELIMRSIQRQSLAGWKGRVHLVAEGRSSRQDTAAEKRFELVRMGKHVLSPRPLPDVRLTFAEKASNSTGLQVADWAARPVARHALDPTETNQIWDRIASLVDGTGRESLPDDDRFRGVFLEI